MKKQIFFAVAVLISSFSFSQKDELKAAERAIKDNNFAEAKAAIASAESLITNEDDKTKAKFYFLKGQAYYANGAAANKDIDLAIESFNMVEKIEGGSGKYSDDVSEIKKKMLSGFLTKGNDALEKKNYSLSSNSFEKAYRMSPKDTLYLYYAAATAVTAQDFDTALKHYLELKNMGFKGVEMEYTAVSKETGEKESFGNAAMRDISVKAGTHISPKDTKSDSKDSEIVKNIALIYVNKGENEKAIAAMKDARKANPDDFGLILSEANVQLKMGNKAEFKKLIEEATEKDPNNAELQYNLGVLAAEAGDKESAKKYYNKAISLDPNYSDAQTNMAVLILNEEQTIIEQMNALGSSAADNKKYDELKQKREDLYREAIPYLEASLKINPNNIQAAKTLMNIYSAIDDRPNLKIMKAKVEALEAAGEN
ncbi:MAG: tetratricopeptide repeat protein [Gelidibacter sp.]|nr:tetratricopeptide repeat protein [Gelidibacter sp.]